MEKWIVTTLLLCLYGCFKEMRPSEPFITEYLIGPWMNFTSDQVEQQIFPLWTYSYLSSLVLIFLLTDFLRYKPVIIFGSLCYITCWCLLIWGKGIVLMQIMDSVYGMTTATEIAYYTYIYSIVSEDIFQKVTSFTRTATLVGSFLSGVTSQILVSTKAMNYRELNFITLASVSMAFIFSLLLPSSPQSIYFCEERDSVDNRTKVRKFKKVIQILISEIKITYTNIPILKWSIWWALATCGNLQIGNYIQPLWEDILPSWTNSSHNNGTSEVDIYNGAVVATNTALGAAVAFSVGYVHIRWNIFGDIILGTITAFNAAILVMMPLSNIIWICYVGYIVVGVSYQGLITIVSYEIVKVVPKDSQGLIFGFNTFMALLLQTILTTVLVSQGLRLSPKHQFIAYGIYYASFAIVFLLLGIRNIFKLRKKKEVELEIVEKLEDKNDNNVELEEIKSAEDNSELSVSYL